jgi:hypothetical protein
MTIQDLKAKLDQYSTKGDLSFQNMGKESYGFALILLDYLPFSESMTLKNAKVIKVSEDRLSIQHETTWGIVTNVVAKVTFESKDQDIVAGLQLQLPHNFSLKIPNVEWFSLDTLVYNLQSVPRKLVQFPLQEAINANVAAIIRISNIPIPIKIGFTSSNTWILEGNFEFIDFPSLSDLLSLLGSSKGIHLPSSLNDLTKIVIYDVTVAFNLDTKSVLSAGFEIGSSPKQAEPWHIIPEVFEIDSYKLGLTVSNPISKNRAIGGLISAKLHFGKDACGFDVNISANHPPSGVWEFKGSTGKDEILNIGALLNDLSSKFNVLLPTVLTSFTLKDVSIDFNTASDKNFKFEGQCTCDFKISETSIELTIFLGFTKKEQGGYNKNVDGKLKIKTAQFEVKFEEETEKIFTASWSDEKYPIEFEDIAQVFGFSLPHIPNDLDLGLKSASFTYEFTKQEFVFTAESVNYGKAVFIGFKDQKWQFFSGLAVGKAINLSNLPLVGQELAKIETISVDQLQVMISSATIHDKQAANVNKLIPADYPRIPPSGTASKLGLSADIIFGSDSKHLSLGMGDTSKQAVSSSSQQTVSNHLPSPSSETSDTKALVAVDNDKSDNDNSQQSVKWFNLQKTFGPVTFKKIGVSYKDQILWFLLDGALSISGLTINLIGMSFGSPLKTFAPKFNLHGLGIDYQKSPLEIGGSFLLVEPPPKGVSFQYDGDAVIKFEEFSLAAIGSYAQLTTGQPSMFIFAQIEAPFGGPPPFFITGLSAGFGYNRTIKIPAQDEVLSFPLLALASSQSGDKPKPADVLAILEGQKADSAGKKKAWISPYVGEYWLAVGIEFTSFELVKSKALLIGKFGEELELALLGLSTLRLPQEGDTIYAKATLELEVLWKPAAGFFGLSAVLSPDSFVIDPNCHLTGGFAFYIWYSGDKAGQFVITLGGYHPQFHPLPYYPTEPRLGFNWPVSGVVTIKGEAYFALTPSCVMAGGGLEFLFHAGDLRAWFIAHADILISWKPFHYIAAIGVSIGASYRLFLLFTTVTLKIELGASLELQGPPMGGKAHVHWFVISFTVYFGHQDDGASHEPLDWNDFKTLLPSLKDHANTGLAKKLDVCKIQANTGLAKKLDDGAWVVRADDFTFSTETAIPAKSVKYGDKGQPINKVPYAFAIRPMNKTDVDSQHVLKIFKDNDTKPFDVSGWDLEPIVRNMPESLWGTPLHENGQFVQNPSTPSSKTIPNAPVGIKVRTPRPELGHSIGEIKMALLQYEPIKPDGQMPLSPQVSPSNIYLPSIHADTVTEIKNIMASSAQQHRNDIYAVLTDSSAYSGTHGPLTNMAKSAGHLYTDSPLQV